MNNIKVIKIIVEARAGAEISACIREAIELSAKEWKDVELRHNDKILTVDIDKLAGTVEVTVPSAPAPISSSN